MLGNIARRGVDPSPSAQLFKCSNNHTGAGHRGTSKSLFAKLVLPRPASEKTEIHVLPMGSLAEAGGGAAEAPAGWARSE